MNYWDSYLYNLDFKICDRKYLILESRVILFINGGIIKFRLVFFFVCVRFYLRGKWFLEEKADE